MLDPKLRQRPAELLILRPHPRHFANQIANHADQIGMRQVFQRITRRQCHSKLESHFQDCDSPRRPEICPGYGSGALTPSRQFSKSWSDPIKICAIKTAVGNCSTGLSLYSIEVDLDNEVIKCPVNRRAVFKRLLL